MSSHPENLSEMTCSDFENSFDEYVDDMLDATLAAAARRHASACPPCNREVTRWQQTRILLSTAVADFATAVDVSSLHRDIEAALGLTPTDGEQRRRGALRAASRARGGSDVRPSARRSNLAPASGRRVTLQAAWRFVSAAAVSASVAAAAVLVLSPSPQLAGTTVASAPSSSRSMFQPAAFRGQSERGPSDSVQVGYTPPPLARPEISHVDGLEAAPGQLVSTWVQPRTNARVIWVEDRGMGAPIRTAGLDR